MQSYTSPSNFGSHKTDTEPTAITLQDFEALRDVEPGTEAAHRLLGRMSLVGGGFERVKIVDTKTGEVVKEGHLNTTDDDLGTFARHIETTTAVSEAPEESGQANGNRNDGSTTDDVDVLALATERTKLNELLVKASDAIEATTKSEVALAQNISGRLQNDLIALRAQLMRADSEGPWQGNRLLNNQRLLRLIEDFTNDALSVVKGENGVGRFDEDRQVKVSRSELDEACSVLSSVIQQDERVRPIIAQLSELTYNYGILASLHIDASTLQRSLLQLGNAKYDPQITISDAVSIVSSITLAAEDFASKLRGSSVRKTQLASELRSFQKRLQHQ